MDKVAPQFTSHKYRIINPDIYAQACALDGATCVPNPDNKGGTLYYTKGMAGSELTKFMGDIINQGHAVWVGTGSSEQDDPAHFTKHTLTINHVLAMFKDPSKHSELKRLWNTLSADRKQQLTDQIKNLQANSVAPSSSQTQSPQLTPSESTAFVNMLYNMTAEQRHAFFADMDPRDVASIRTLIARSNP